MFRALSAALFISVLAAPAAAYEEFPPTATAKQRFMWGQQAYSYYCPVPPPPNLRNVRFEDLNPVAQGALGWVSKKQIADYIQDNCGAGSSVAAEYVQN